MATTDPRARSDRAALAVEPLVAARRLLGARLRANGVTIRIVEVEAYHGQDDPASHAFRGRTERNAVMFGPAGRLYVYRSYGIHTCVNVSAGPDGVGWAVLLRAGEVLDGVELAAARRGHARQKSQANLPSGPSTTPSSAASSAAGSAAAERALAQLARGPGNLGAALGLTLADGGVDLLDPASRIQLSLPTAEVPFLAGPRVGVSVNADVPWRLWAPGSRAVSAYRRSPRAPAPSPDFPPGSSPQPPPSPPDSPGHSPPL